MSGDFSVDLLKGEEVDVEVKPHPLSFLKYHFMCVYLMFVAVFLGWVYSYFKSNSSILGFLNIIFGFMSGLKVEDIALLVLFWVILLLSGFAIGVLWVTKMPLLYMVLVAVAGTALELYFLAPYDLAQKPMVKLWLLGVAAVLGMVLTEAYRRGHCYVITNYRIIMRKKFITKSEREIMYDKITDVYVEQGITGRIFNFGTVN
ncbi:MAG: PH domain-containing protein, partial [Candidatus Bathyarchaeia archaeon]